MEIAGESASPFTFHEAIKRLCQITQKSLKKVEEHYMDILDLPVMTLYKEKYPVFLSLGLNSGQRYMMIRRSKRDEKHFVYDYMVDFRYNRNFENKFLSRSNPVIWIIDYDTGVLILETRNKKKIPPFQFWRQRRQGMKASLWDILGLHHLSGTEEPQTKEALEETIRCHGVNINQRIEILYLIDFGNRTRDAYLDIEPVPGEGTNQHPNTFPTLSFYAYPISGTKLGYAFKQPPKVTRNTCIPYTLPTEDDIPTPDPYTANRRVGVQVQLAGLTLVYQLGLCTKDEMHQASEALSRCVGGMWITFDDEKHPRHVAFTAGTAAVVNHNEAKRKHAVQLESCDGENVKQWTDILKVIQACASDAQKEKEAILTQIMARLQPFYQQRKRDLWSKCYNQLKSTIHKYKVFLYGIDDVSMHAIKCPIAGHFKTKGSKGIALHVLADNVIGGLSTRDIDFLNMDAYLNYDGGKAFDPWLDDVNLWKLASDWFPITGEDTFVPWFSPRLRHNKQKLRNYPKMFGDTSMLQYLKDRGFRNADAVRQLWYQLNNLLVTSFNYDLASRGHTSASKIAFDIVWLNYTLTAGPFAHSLEVLHPFAEHLLRPYCTGGFSYSARAYLKEGQGLEGEQNDNLPSYPPAEKAVSVRELDLTSAYGFSGSNMSTPKGFGITFGCGMKTQRRYNLFEYRAVYYTIYKWVTDTNSTRGKLISVFSNFSPLGIIFVGKYPVDLVGIFEDGTVDIVQMDGHFCHGDYERNCNTLDRYADGKSREECEEKTKERDEYILNWMIQVNQDKMKYSVITDCCHEEYRPSALKHFFKTCTDTRIRDLVDGLDAANGTLDSVDLDKVTFFALVEGYLPSSEGHQFGPVFPSNRKGSEAENPIEYLLTSDYYKYLVENHGFEVTKVRWISYYKRCRDLPKVFQELVTFRQQFPKDSSVASVIKSLVNYACGYFGLHRSKHPFSRARIVYQIPTNYNPYRHSATYLPDYDDKELYLLQTLFPTAHLKNKSTTPLLNFVGVIEYGKLRMNSAIQVLQRHLRPTAFRLLYSNVDNLIVACSSDKFEDALQDVSPAGIEAFHNDWLPLQGSEPGCFKDEWFVGSGRKWEFVTPYQMFYAITTSDGNDDRHKSSLFKHLVSQESFQHGLSMWKNERVTVDIEKRKNKLVDTSTHMVTHRM